MKENDERAVKRRVIGMETREIRLRTVRNMRELGGLRTVDGRTLKQGRLLRSAALHQLSVQDGQRLAERQGLRLVIDLRTENEAVRKPDRIPSGIEYVHIPVFSEKMLGISREKAPTGRELLTAMPDMRTLYARLVTDEACVRQLSLVLHRVLAQREGAVLWHCTAGKDRCGLVSVLVLSILGVSSEDILADYLLTNRSVRGEGLRYEWLVTLLSRSRETGRRVRELYMAKEEYLSAALEAIEERHGGMEHFLHGPLGLSEDEMNSFRAHILL